MLTISIYLVDSGSAWTMQGSYGRYAADLIDAGLIKGEVPCPVDDILFAPIVLPLQLGSIVVIRGNSRAMTVVAFGEADYVTCAWHDEDGSSGARITGALPWNSSRKSRARCHVGRRHFVWSEGPTRPVQTVDLTIVLVIAIFGERPEHHLFSELDLPDQHTDDQTTPEVNRRMSRD
jgi:hypothetical protein